MKKILSWVVGAIVVASVVYAAQQTVVSTDTFNQAFTKTNANDTELYGKWTTLGTAYDTSGELDALFGGKQDADPFLTDIAALTDPNADRLLFWDDSVGDLVFLTLGTNLSITGTTLDATGGSATVEDTAYGATWNGDTDGTSKNTIYDYLVNFDADADGDYTDETWFPSGTTIAWDDITSPDAAKTLDFGAFVQSFKLGVNGAVRFTNPTGEDFFEIGYADSVLFWRMVDGGTAGNIEMRLPADGIDDLMIDWGTGTNQVSAVDVPIADSGAIITATEIEGALQENRTAIDLNTAKTTNATHTGDVTGSGALTIANDAVTEPKLSFSNSPTDGYIPTYNSAGTNQTWVAFPVSIGVAISDETTDLTTGTAKVTFRAPFAFTLTEVRASVNTAPVGSTIVIDINENGTSVLSTKLTIDASEETSETAAAPPVISDSTIAADAEITSDIDQIGSSTAGKGAKIWLIGTRIL